MTSVSATTAKNTNLYYMSLKVGASATLHPGAVKIPPELSLIELPRASGGKKRRWARIPIANTVPDAHQKCMLWTSLCVRGKCGKANEATFCAAGSRVISVKLSLLGKANCTAATGKLKKRDEARECVSPDSGISCNEILNPFELGSTCELGDENTIASGVAAEIEICEELVSEELYPASRIMEQSARKIEFLSLLGLSSVTSRIFETPVKRRGGALGATRRESAVSAGGFSNARERTRCRNQWQQSTCFTRHADLDVRKSDDRHAAALQPASKPDPTTTMKRAGKRSSCSQANILSSKRIKENIKVLHPNGTDTENNNQWSSRGSSSPINGENGVLMHVRTTHNNLERERRHCLRRCFLTLHDQIPELRCRHDTRKASKHLVLTETRKYCLELLQNERKLIAERDFLIERNRHLRENYILTMKALLPDGSETTCETFSWLARPAVAIQSLTLLDHSYSTPSWLAHKLTTRPAAACDIERQADDSIAADAGVTREAEDDVDVVGLNEFDSAAGVQKSTGNAEGTDDESDCEFRIISVRSLAADCARKRAGVKSIRPSKNYGRSRKIHAEASSFLLPRCSRLRMRKHDYAKGRSKHVLVIETDYGIAEPLPCDVTSSPVEESDADFKISDSEPVVLEKKQEVTEYFRSKLQQTFEPHKNDADRSESEEQIPESISKAENCGKLPAGKFLKSIAHFGRKKEMIKTLERKSKSPEVMSHAQKKDQISQSADNSENTIDVKTDVSEVDKSRSDFLSESTKATSGEKLLVPIDRRMIDSLSIIENVSPTVKLERMKISSIGDCTDSPACDSVTPKSTSITNCDCNELTELCEPYESSHLTTTNSDNNRAFLPTDCLGRLDEGDVFHNEANRTIDKISELRKMLRQKEADLEKIRKSMVSFDDCLFDV